jgi:hypothetical protein
VLTANQLNGISLERTVTWFMAQKLHVKTDHNRFDNFYPLDNHNAVDMVTDKALIECTNPKETTKFEHDADIENKFDYFKRKDPTHNRMWFFVISFITAISTAMLKLAHKLGIIIIALGYHSEPTTFWSIIKRLFHTRLYYLLKKRAPSSIVHSVVTKPSIVVNANTTTTGSKQALHQHTSIKVEYTQTRFPDRERFPDTVRFEVKKRFN